MSTRTATLAQGYNFCYTPVQPAVEVQMEKSITLRRVGGSLGGTFPKEVMDRLNVGEGDKLFLVEHENGVLLTPYDPKFEKVMKAYEIFSRKYRNALRELAK
jgi:putative addiction module antidote